MKYQKTVTALVLVIFLFSLAASTIGFFSSWGQEAPGQTFQSIFHEDVEVFGRGVYRHDSVSIAAQGISQDVVTLVLGLPLLLLSLLLARRGLLKGRLLLTGTVGYFLYAYTSYAFLSMYNPLFLIYVLLMSSSLFCFILCMLAIDTEQLKDAFQPQLPVKFIGGFQLFIAFTLLLLWLAKIIPSLTTGASPAGLDHYTTLVIQALDLGIMVPVAILSGVLLMRKKSLGYLLSSVVIIKGITMLTAITAMLIGQHLAGIPLGIGEIIAFPAFILVMVICLILLLRNINENRTLQV
jgi:hypothetical protein